jgi:hypothetical protein
MPLRDWSRQLILCFIVLASAAAPARAQLETLETDRMRIIYVAPFQSYLAPYAARCFENSLAFQKKLFDWESDEKLTVILTDFSDYGNAGAGAVPRNGVALSVAPMNFVYETYPSNERMNTLANHELVHVACFDRASGADPFFRRLFFGKVKGTAEHPETIIYNYLTAPRASAPRWFHEGIATFIETQMAGGIGRAQGSYDEMVFRSMVRDGTQFYDPLSLVSEGTKANFQVEMNSYLYGTRFMSWIAWEHGPDKLIEWVRRSPGSKGFHAKQYEHVFGQSLQDGWKEWVAFEQEFQQVNLDSLRQYPITEVRDIGHEGLGSVSRSFYDHDAGKIYSALNYPGTVAHLAAIDVETGKIDKLEDIKGPMMYQVTSLAFDPAGKQLFFSADNGAMRDVMVYDIATDESRKVLRDERIGDLSFDRSDSSLWGVRHDAGFASIVRIPHPWEEWNLVHTFDFWTVPFDLDISPDGQRVSYTVLEASGRAELNVVERDSLLAGTLEPVASLDFGTTAPMNFVFDDTGKKLYGSSYLTGVSNIFSFEPDSLRWEALSNAETGLFRPIPTGKDSLIVFQYTGDGFVPGAMQAESLEDIAAVTLLGAEVRLRYPELEEWRVGSPRDVPIDSMITYRGEYNALGGVEFESLHPIVEGYKDYVAWGLRTNLSDPLSMHRFTMSASVSPQSDLESDEQFHASLNYRRHDWRVSAAYNDADFYDLFGPTKRSRKGYSVGTGYTKTLLYDMPREAAVDASLTYYGGLETSPSFQNVAVQYEELLAGRIRFDFKNRRFSLGAVDYEKGLVSNVVLVGNHVESRTFLGLLGSVQLGLPLFRHSSFWVRGYGGVAPRDDDPSFFGFSNFFFGGFGNNWIDSNSVQRYREWYAMPGFDLNQIPGTNFLKLMGEWNLPPWRFKRGGRPSFYASWLRGSLFAIGLATNVDDANIRTESATLGGQLDLRMTLLSNHDFTASVGYAVGFTEGRRGTDEFMVSLRIH